MKTTKIILFCAFLITICSCTQNPEIDTSISTNNASLYGEWYYLGESVNGAEFRLNKRGEIINIDNSQISDKQSSITYTLDANQNTLTLEDGRTFSISELSSERLILKCEDKHLVLQR